MDSPPPPPSVNAPARGADRFDRPQDVARATGLSRRRRLQLLDDWALRLADRDIAVSETGRSPASDNGLMGDLAAAIAAVEAEPRPAVGRLWRRLTAG